MTPDELARLREGEPRTKEGRRVLSELHRLAVKAGEERATVMMPDGSVIEGTPAVKYSKRILAIETEAAVAERAVIRAQIHTGPDLDVLVEWLEARAILAELDAPGGEGTT
jgi:hypothetical protein